MSKFAIQTVDLNHHFGNQTVVKNLSLQVPKGSIYGFLGPNGAGKTTTIKILLNLLKSPADHVFIFGKELTKNRTACLQTMGSLVEQPAIYSHLSGKENLVNRCILLGLPKSKVAEMLALVGLTAAADKKAGKYSLGMKQRLGIALALIADPEILLLDEPTNGLDPNGIIEIRNLMIDLTQNHGKTILVSSHLLAEIERTATHVGIINHGEMLFQGTINELQALSKPSVKIEVNDTEKAILILSQNGAEVKSKLANEITINYTTKNDMAKFNQLLINGGITVFSIYTERKDLENLFLDITTKLNYMRSFYISLVSEFYKSRKTLAFWAAIIVPVVICGLIAYGFYSNAHNAGTAKGMMLWFRYISASLGVMGMLILPFYVMFMAFSINNIEHKNDTWKTLFSQPLNTFGIYAAKYFYALTLLLICLFLFASLTYTTGYLLQALKPNTFTFNLYNPSTLLINFYSKLFLASLGILSLQFVLSLIWSDFLKPMGFGFIAIVMGIIGANVGWKYAYLNPYSAPAIALNAGRKAGKASKPEDLEIFTQEIWVSLTVALILFISGYFILSKRNIK